MPVVTTYLEMVSPDQIVPSACADPLFRVVRAGVPQWQVNRFLYQFVGGPWNWDAYLEKTEAEWRALTEAGDLHTWIALYDGSPAGYFELRQADGEVEIWHFGLAQPFIGRGLGGPLLTQALEQAWRLGPSRVWVHTCTKDHPAALANYVARGLKPYRVDTETD